VLIEYSEDNQPRRLLFTADVGRYGTPIIRDPADIVGGAVDHLITESTYGGRRHSPVGDIEPHLLDCVKWAIQRRSRVLLPSFAVGRTQTILWYMRKFMQEKQIPPINVYVDSPMGVEVTHVHEQFPDHYDDETRGLIGKTELFTCPTIRFASSSQQSREINADRGPAVIIASSPACEFGRILHHLKQSVERPDDMVVFTGWIPANTLGRRLQEGQKRVRIYDRFYDVNCRVDTLHGLSAHADSEELMRFLNPALKPTTVAHIVHGEPEQAETFARRLVAAGVASASVPAMGGSVFGK
jgi:metallo-beta-lactamase family protein